MLLVREVFRGRIYTACVLSVRVHASMYVFKGKGRSVFALSFP